MRIFAMVVSLISVVGLACGPTPTIGALHACDTPIDAELDCPFVEGYRHAFGGEPDIYAAHGYDAMRVALKALLEARSVRVRDLQRYMRVGLKEFDGVTGTIAFDERGDVRRYPVMHTIVDGRVVRCSWLAEQKRRELRRFLEGATSSRCLVPLQIHSLDV
jgi:hypothetical protein